MNYWAKDDPLFADGHYVEDWELSRFDELSPPVRALVLSEAAAGNKVETIHRHFVKLQRPPSCGVLDLPEGLAFFCPIYHEGTRVYDGSEDGMIKNPETGETVIPSGHEGPDLRQMDEDAEGSRHAP
jgi:hypothetical protein